MVHSECHPTRLNPLAERTCFSQVIIEKEAGAGSYFQKYPRHRQLISINKMRTGHDADLPARSEEFNLRHDWNSLVNGAAVGGQSILMQNFSNDYFPSADSLVEYLQHFATEYNLNIDYSQEVMNIAKPAGGTRPFVIKTAAGLEYGCTTIVVCTGLWKPLLPTFQGIEHLQTYDNMSVDPSDYVDQSILVIGNGNAALETAGNLIESANYVHVTSRSPVRLALATHYVGDVRLTGCASRTFF
jgi:cation diffusion facilitator CzcD-associated flavoprotein CzcO